MPWTTKRWNVGLFVVCFSSRRLLSASPTAAAAFAGATITGMSTTQQVNLLDLAAACVACTVTASRSILQLMGDKNTRFKADGSFVTDADFRAQGVIVQAIQSVSPHVQIIGEESPEEMAQHIAVSLQSLDTPHAPNSHILEQTRQEIRLLYHYHKTRLVQALPDILPLAEWKTGEGNSLLHHIDLPTDPDEVSVDASRVCVIVDPLDGTKSYATGDYDSVSILIGICIDYQPVFGVVGKPFGYTGVTTIHDSGCATLYGGTLLDAAYVAGGRPITKPPLVNQPRAVISSSRSKGIVEDFCLELGRKGLIHPEPLLVSGAGEKSLRLILPRQNESLWFFPKPGTSRWDVAAPDALLRVLGGRLTDKHGREMDYHVTRENSDNEEGVVACIDAQLHDHCIRLFGEWITTASTATGQSNSDSSNEPI